LADAEARAGAGVEPPPLAAAGSEEGGAVATRSTRSRGGAPAAQLTCGCAARRRGLEERSRSEGKGPPWGGVGLLAKTVMRKGVGRREEGDERMERDAVS
jgi:hypothetical protein